MITTDKSYPSTLPYPIRDGYEARTVQTFVRTEMGSGRSRQRRLFSHVPTMVSVTWIFNQDGDAAAFEAWFRDVTNDGADWFNCPLKTPLGAKEYVCRFTEMYTGPDLVGLCAWRSTAMLEIYERQILPDGWGNLPDWAARWSEFDVLMNWVWPLAMSDNVTLLTETGQTIIMETPLVNETPATGSAVKISELPLATILTGDEYIPLVQGGVTKRAKAVNTADVPNPDADYLTYYESSRG